MPSENIKVCGDAIKIHGREIPEKVALIFKDERYTYGQLLEMSNRLANGLIDLGVKKGDKVALLIHNVPEYTVCHFALNNIGAVSVSVNTRFVGREIKYIAEQSDAVAIILTSQFLGEYGAIRSDLNNIKAAILIERFEENMNVSKKEEILQGKSEWSKDYVLYNDILKKYSPEDPGVQVFPEDEHAIWYTSGTTGFPKGAVMTHYASVTGARNVLAAFENIPDDTVLMVLPLFHNGYQLCCYTTYYLGATVNLMESFTPVTLLEEIQKNRPTVFLSVPAILTLLLYHPERPKYDLSSLTKIFYGANLSTEENIRKMQETFNCKLLHAYGQSEYTPAITVLRDEDGLRKFGSIGTPINNEIVIMDDDNHIVPPNTIGEICVRGEAMMMGYYNKSDDTAQKIIDGWLHTTDMGYLDEDGFLYFKGRKDDMIDRGGENIHPADVENTISEFPKVRDVAVIGVPDSVMGAAVKAFVVLKQGEESFEEEILAFCCGKIADYKIPRYVEFLGELPINASGKVLKRVLREGEIARYNELGAKVYEEKS